MEEIRQENWSSDMEMDDHEVNECLCHANPFDEEFLREILPQPQEALVTTPTSSQYAEDHKPITSSATTYILSFEKSAALLPADPDSCSAWKENSQSQLLKEILPLPSSRVNQGTKKTRSASESLDHLMSERNRRQELTRKFIALAATIPGLKKMDKAHVLREAINYVKQLQERVDELEEDIQKNDVESAITITKSHLCVDDKCNDLALVEVEARVLGKEVLIKIHCAKQKGVLLKIMSQLERLHLYISTSNVLPFGNTLDITIIAQMGEKYKLVMKDLVKELRQVAMNEAM